MGSERGWRLLAAAAMWLAAGALAALAGESARQWVATLVVGLLGVGGAWPLLRSQHTGVPPPPATATADR